MRNKSLCKSFAISNNTVEFFGDSRSKQFEKDSALYKIGLHLNSFSYLIKSTWIGTKKRHKEYLISIGNNNIISTLPVNWNTVLIRNFHVLLPIILGYSQI